MGKPATFLTPLVESQRRQRRLRIAGLLASAAVGAVMTTAAVLYPTSSAYAACSSTTGGNPDIFQCTGLDTNGNQAGGTTGDSLNIIINPGAIVTASNSTGPIFGNTIGYIVSGTTLNYTQNDPFSTVSGDGATGILGQGATVQILHTNGAAVQNWTINGQMNNGLGDTIVDTIIQGGGTANVTMTIGAAGDVRAGDDAMTFNFVSLGGSTSNLNWTNNGDVLAGGDAVVVNHALGGGTLNLVNNNDMGVGAPIGGNAFQIISPLGNLTTNITNNDTGTIITNGDTAFVVAPLTTNPTTVNNFGVWTSNNGLAANMLVGDDAIVNNTGPDAVMNGGVSLISLLTGDADFNNTGGATWNFTGLSLLASVTGSSTINNTGGSLISSVGLSSTLVQAALIDTTLNNDASTIFQNTFDNTIFQIAGNNTTINNTNDASLLQGVLQGLDTNVIAQIAFNNATINNTGGSVISQWGISNTIAQGAVNDATINNVGSPDNRALIEQISIDGVNTIFQFAGNNALIFNDPADIIQVGLVNTIGQIAIVDATITNTDASTISQSNGGGTNALFNTIFQIAGNNATINNTLGSDIEMIGVVNTIAQVAGNNTELHNLDSTISMTGGGANTIFQFAFDDAIIVNDPAAIIMVGLVNTIGQIAIGDTTLTNADGSSISMSNGGAGSALFNTIFQIAGNNATINNTDGPSGPSTITMDGVFNTIAQVAGNNTEIHNLNGSTIAMVGGGVNTIFQFAFDDAFIVNGGTSASSITMEGVFNTIGQIAIGDTTLTNSDGSTIAMSNGAAGSAIANTIFQIAIIDNATINNTGASRITMDGDINTIFQLAGTNTNINNTGGSAITMTNQGGAPINTITQIAVVDANILNQGTDSLIQMGGPDSINVVTQLAGNNATIINDQNATFRMGGSDSVNVVTQFAVNNTTFINDNGASFAMGNTNPGASTNVFTAIALNDASFRNDNGATFLMGGEGSTNVLTTIAGNDASFINDNGADFTMGGAGSTNVLTTIALNDASFRNDNGASFRMGGADSTNFFTSFAVNNNSFVNDNNASFAMGNTSPGGSFNAFGLGSLNNTTFLNDNGASFLMGGVDSVNFFTLGAANNATFTNDRDAQFTMTDGAALNVFTMISGNNSELNNDRGADFRMLGDVNFLTMIALGGGADVTINNSNGASMIFGNELTDASFITMIAGPGGAATINNSTGAQIVTTGFAFFGLSGSEINNSANNANSNDNCSLLAGICVNGVAVFTGILGDELEFNNQGGLLSMINGVSDYGVATVPSFNTRLGDLTIINGDFNASGNSQLGLDAFLAGPGAGSAADLLVITNIANTDGQVTGTGTGMVIANGNNPGQYNPYQPGAGLFGIPVVSVFSGQTVFDDFYIDPQSNFYAVKSGEGVIDKGLFFYAHDLVPSPNIPGGLVHILVGLPDEEAFQFAYAVAGAQNIWYETANSWMDKQNDLRGKQAQCAAGSGADLPVKARRPEVVCAPQSGWGVWMKAVGSWTNRDSSQTVYSHNNAFTFDLGYKQDIFGVLAGVDWTRSGPVDTAQVGIFGGYVDSKLKFNSATAATKFDYTGGMVGVTGTYINRGWFIDGLFKADFLNMDINMPSVAAFSGGSNTGVDVTNIGAMGNFGYRWQWNPTWYLEGIATLAYVSTQIDNAQLNGTTVQWEDGKSFRGAIGGRVGTVFTGWANKRVDASLTGRVWNEWEGTNSATLFTAGPAFTVFDDGLHNKPFGEVVGMLEVANFGVGWGGFINAGVKFNDDFTTTTAKGGVRYQW